MLQTVKTQLQEPDIFFEKIHVKNSTFRAGVSQKIHRWFRLTPSFGPDLVNVMLEELSVQNDETVLDPFSGAGTTAIECSLEGIKSVGFEINPFLHFINEACLNWDFDSAELRNTISKIEKKFIQTSKVISLSDLEKAGYPIPPIHNPFRWWREDVVKDILLIKKLIDEECSENERKFMRLGLAAVLVPDLTNVTLGRLQLHFIDKSDVEISAIETFANKIEEMICDVDEVQSLPNVAKGQVFLQDSMNLSPEILSNVKVNCAITSPPYPNRYSYVWNTRPHLFMLDFFTTPKEASSLDKKTIGGTWGTATSELAKGIIEPVNDAVKWSIKGLDDEIRKHDNLMANYMVHYFNRLTDQILEMQKIAGSDFRLAYVVGNSRLKGVYVDTDIILGNIIDSLDIGMKTNKIHRFRKRNSGKDLFETIVYASKS